MQIERRKFFQAPREGEYANAILTYSKRPMRYQSEQIPFDPGAVREPGEVIKLTNHTKVQYQHRIRLDLYFFIIRADWLGRWTKAPN